MTEDKHLVLIGVGPGIGRSVACLFASERYNRVSLIARRAAQLEVERDAVLQATVGSDVDVKTYAVDVADKEALLRALADAERIFGKPECIYYNAARVVPSKLLSHDVDEIEYDFKVRVRWSVGHFH
jgi:NAD(P)-dependent dehydrogenase (short-subunit alcohol dehydrogenase family)